jgi:hypothetical protein
MGHQTGRSCLQCKVGEEGVKGYYSPNPEAIEFRTHGQTKRHMDKFLAAAVKAKELKKDRSREKQAKQAEKTVQSLLERNGVRYVLDMLHSKSCCFDLRLQVHRACQTSIL